VADSVVSLRWEGEGLRFRGGAEGRPEGVVDGDGVTAPSPVQTLLLALAGCTAADLVLIADRMRVPLGGLSVVVEGDRRAEPPRRFTRIVMRFRVSGMAAEDEPKVRRALDLSAEKYCSVLHSLRTDDLEVRAELELT